MPFNKGNISSLIKMIACWVEGGYFDYFVKTFVFLGVLCGFIFFNHEGHKVS